MSRLPQATWVCVLVVLAGAAAAAREDAGWKSTSGSYRLWLPPAAPVRAIFLLNSYGAFREFADDRRLRQLGTELNCAIVANGAEKYEGALEALADLAEKSGHREIAHAPLFVFGHSNSTHTMAQFARTMPERIVAWVAMKSAFGAQFSVPELYRIPGQCISGEKDRSYFQDQLETVKKLRRENGALMNMIVEPDGEHGPNDNTWNIMLAFLKNAFLVRVPMTADPRKGPVKLIALSEESGWLGKNLDGVRVRYRDGKDLFWRWETDVVVRQKLPIGPYDKFKGDRTTASWFPTEDYALKWQEFCHTGMVTDWSTLRAPVRVGRR